MVLAEIISAVIGRGLYLQKISVIGDCAKISPELILHQSGCDVG